VYGTVRTVVWEDGGSDPASYPISPGSSPANSGAALSHPSEYNVSSITAKDFSRDRALTLPVVLVLRHQLWSAESQRSRYFANL